MGQGVCSLWCEAMLQNGAGAYKRTEHNRAHKQLQAAPAQRQPTAHFHSMQAGGWSLQPDGQATC